MKRREKTKEQLKEDLRNTREELAVQKWGLEKTLGGMKVLVKEVGEAKAEDEAILASIGDGLIATDQNARVIFMNEACEKLIGWEKENVIGKSWFEVMPMEDDKGYAIPDDKRPIRQAISSRKSTTTTTTTSIYYFVRKDKTKFPVAVTATPIILDGKVIGAIGVYRDITHEIEVDKAKSEFVSLASHQLRTPLGIMKWYIEVLQKEDYLQKAPQQTREYFDEVSKSNERVLSLVRDLLSVSRIDQGRVKNEPKVVDIKKLVTEIVEQMQIMAKKKKVTLALTISDPKTPSINIDELRLHEVIENLIVNAVEYTEAAGHVDVTLNKESDTLLIKVKDTGIGISATDQKNLFTKFFRSEKAVGHNPEGSGLGLYLAKSYVKAWGGKISVESTENKGSTFSISLPMKGGDKNEKNISG